MSAKPASRRFPWRAVMAVGFGVMRLSPQAFWSMTPREFAAALDAVAGDAEEAPNRADLSDLMLLYPDGMFHEGSER